MAVSYPSPIPYDRATGNGYTVRSLKSDFGDGYQEVTRDGINAVVQNGTLVHALLEKDDSAKSVGADTLRSFLKQYAGSSTVVTIENRMEDPTGSTPLNVYLDSWSEKYDGVLYSFSVKFREAFNV